MTDAGTVATYLKLFDQIWQDNDKVEDVTARICEHIETVYQDNSPEFIYFLILYNIFNEFSGRYLRGRLAQRPDRLPG